MSGWGVALVVALVASGASTRLAAALAGHGESLVAWAETEERGEPSGVMALAEPARAVTRVVADADAGLDDERVVRRVAGRAADKAALYGDPALVPTRAGERARQELALAAAVAAAVAARADGGAPVVEVRLPGGVDGGGADVGGADSGGADSGGADSGAVVVAGEVALAAEEVMRIVEAVVGPWSVGRVAVFVRSPRAGALAAAGRPGPAGLDWPLVLALVGFGVSAGIAVERLRRGSSR